MLSFFKFLSNFDWISPTNAILEDIVEGGPLDFNVWTFFVPFDEAQQNGWTAFGIQEVLAKNGIKSWGGLLYGDEFFFKVKLNQARWAEYVLLRNNIPIHARSASPPESKRKKTRLSKGLKNSSKDSLSLLDEFLDGDSPPFW